MKLKRVLLAAIAAVLASFAFSSCVKEAPEINYTVEFTHNSDFSSIIEAINSQSSTIAQKLEAVETAVSQGLLSVEEASAALKDALVESLDNQNATLSDLEEALESQNLLLGDKMDVLTAAVNSQTASLEDVLDYKLGLINSAIETGAADLGEALDAFQEVMDEDLEGLTIATDIQTAAQTALGTALVLAVTNGTTTLNRALTEINSSISDQTTALKLRLDLIAATVASGAVSIRNAINAFEDTVEEGLDDIADATNIQTAAQTALGVAIATAISRGSSSIEDALADLQDAMEDGLGDIRRATNIQTLVQGIAGGLMSYLIYSGTNKLEDALTAINESVTDQTLRFELQLEAIKAAIDAGTLGDKQNANAILSRLQNLEQYLGVNYTNIVNAIRESYGLEPIDVPVIPETTPFYSTKQRGSLTDNTNQFAFYMNSAAWQALNSAADPEAAILGAMEDWNSRSDIEDLMVNGAYEGYLVNETHKISTHLNKNVAANFAAAIEGGEVSMTYVNSLITTSYAVTNIDVEKDEYRIEYYGIPTLGTIRVTSDNARSGGSVLRPTYHTLLYSTDGGTTWSEPVSYTTLVGFVITNVDLVDADGNPLTFEFKYGE